MVVGVGACKGVGLCLREELDALIGLEVVLHPEALARSIDPLVGVRAESVHVAPGLRNTTITHQPRHLVRRLRPQCPEVPLHVVVTQARAGQSLLTTDEVGELDRVLDEEDRGVVADEVVVPVLGVELHGKSARVAPGVRAALFACDSGESDKRLGGLARLKELRLRVAGDVAGDS